MWEFPFNEAGWPVFPVRPDALKVFVSPAGNDAWDGADATKPVRTVKRALSIPTNGRQRVVAFLRGGVWEESFGKAAAGPSPSAPTIITCYGTSGERPKFNCKGRQALNLVGTAGNVILFAMHFEQVGRTGDNGLAGIEAVGASNVYVCGCKFEHFGLNVVAQSAPDSPSQWATNWTFHRNVLSEAYVKEPHHGIGIYLHRLRGVRLTENVLVSNGFGPDAPKQGTNQNAYVTGETQDVEADGNVTIDAAYTGWQARSGGPFRRNFAYQCPRAFNWGLVQGGGPNDPDGVEGTVERNVAYDCEIGFSLANVKSGTWDKNLVLHGGSGGPAFWFLWGKGVDQADAVGLHNLTVTDCVAWGVPKAFVADAELSAGDETYRSVSNVALRRCYGAVSSRAGLLAVQSPRTASDFPDPNRTVERYMQAVGLPGKALKDEVVQQSPFNWRPALSGPALTDYFIEGFFPASTPMPTPTPTPVPTPVPAPPTPKIDSVSIVDADTGMRAVVKMGEGPTVVNVTAHPRIRLEVTASNAARVRYAVQGQAVSDLTAAPYPYPPFGAWEPKAGDYAVSITPIGPDESTGRSLFGVIRAVEDAPAPPTPTPTPTPTPPASESQRQAAAMVAQANAMLAQLNRGKSLAFKRVPADVAQAFETAIAQGKAVAARAEALRKLLS